MRIFAAVFVHVLLLAAAVFTEGWTNQRVGNVARTRVSPTRPMRLHSTAVFPWEGVSGAAESLPSKETAKDAGSKNIWQKTWYPVAVVDELDPSQPNSVTLLGMDLVIWRSEISSLSANGGEKWSVAEDMCPHRLAPLSEGYLDAKTKQLTCRYHGWAFTGEGKCSCIPQAENTEALNNRRNRLQTFPVQVAQGLVWMWPDSEADAADVSKEYPLPLFPDFEGSSFQTRYVPMDYEAMMENTFDPSHAMFLHDSPGSSFDKEEAVPMTKFAREGAIEEAGFDLVHNGYSKKNRNMDALRHFVAPYTNYVRYIMPPSGLQVNTLLYFLPVRPGFTRVIGSFAFKKPEASSGEKNSDPAKMSATIAKGTGEDQQKKKFDFGSLQINLLFGIFGVVTALKKLLLPRWLSTSLDHLRGAGIEEQDIFMMHYQKLNLQKREQSGRDWKNSYFMPTKADMGVLAFRQWFQQFSNGRVQWLDNPTPTAGSSDSTSIAEKLNERDLLDRWSRHTKHCVHCRRSLAFFTSLSEQLPPISFVSATITAIAAWMKWMIPGKQVPHLAVAAPGFATAISLLVRSIAVSYKRKLLRGDHPFGKMVP